MKSALRVVVFVMVLAASFGVTKFGGGGGIPWPPPQPTVLAI